jgi:hypothetical protein
MKIITTLIFILLTTLFVQGQLSGVYSCNKIDCDIYLFEKGSYYIGFDESYTDDIVECTVLSEGFYVVKDNLIVFTDRIHGYIMEMPLNKKIIRPQKAFAFMLNNDFRYCGGSQEFELSASTINSIILQQKRREYKLNNENIYPFRCGIYENEKGYKLTIIQKDNKYQLFFNNVLLLDGFWGKNENELILHDTALRHPFHLLIGDKILISSLLPGDYNSSVLYFREITY